MRPWAKAGIALAGSLLASTAGAVIIEEVVANVNGDIITKTTVTTGRSSFAWRGTVPARIGSTTVAAAPVPGRCALRR